MTHHTLVVGASQAGLATAATLRELGDRGRVTLVGAETEGPYQRPPLSKDYLAGTAGREILPLRTASFYASSAIDLVTGTRVEDLRLSAPGRGGSAILADGTTLPFDRLVLTTGARARRLRVPGHDLDGVTYLRHLDDADDLRSRLPRARHVVVVGGGFVGLEVAAVAETAGTSVTVVEATDRLLGRAVARETSDFYRAAHVRRGAAVLTGATVVGFDGSGGRVVGVRLADGRSLPADLVVVGIGAAPRTELAERAGLEVADGIVVDADARTSRPDVVAAGDCATTVHPGAEGGRLRLESVDNALTQGRVAAATLLGRSPGRRPVPWFWSNQGTLRLQIAGLTAGYDDIVMRGEPDSERFSVLYYRGAELLGVDAVNQPADYMTVRTALSRGATIPRDRAGDAGVKLKDLLVPTHRPVGADRPA